MLTKSKFQKIKKSCNHMPSQLISFYLLISLEGMSTLIRSQGHQIEFFFFLFCFRSRFRSCLLIVLSSRALLSSALSKRLFCNLILFLSNEKNSRTEMLPRKRDFLPLL